MEINTDSYADFRTVALRSQQWNYVDFADSYFLFVQSDVTTYKYSLLKTETADVADFENNYKSLGNPVGEGVGGGSILQSSTDLTTNGSFTVRGIAVQRVALIVNVTAYTSGTLTYTVKEVDPVDGTTAVGLSATGTALTGTGTDVIELSPLNSSAVEVSWTFSGAATVNATLVSRPVPAIVSPTQATLTDLWTNAIVIPETPSVATLYSRTATASLEVYWGFRVKLSSEKIIFTVLSGGVTLFTGDLKDLADNLMLNETGAVSAGAFIQSTGGAAPVMTFSPPAPWYSAGGTTFEIKASTTTGTGAKEATRGWTVRGIL